LLVAVGVLGCGLAFVGCSEPASAPQTGTNTNWLVACESDEDCGGELSCLCGRCTVSCDTPSGCSAFGGVCAEPEATRFQCRAESNNVCLARCGLERSCEVGFACVRGACVDVLPSGACEGDGSVLACEDFESPLSGWTPVVTSGNSVDSSEGSSVSGARALSVDISGGPSVAYYVKAFPPVSAPTLYLRGWVRLPSGLEVFNFAPLALVASQEPGWDLRLVLREVGVEVWSYTTPRATAASLTLGEWHCLRLEVELGEDTAGAVRVFVDAERVAEATGIDTLPTGGIDRFAVGSLWSSSAGSLLVDNIQLATEPVDCYAP
jgi:hypothetical protein